MFSEQPQQCPGFLGRAEGFTGPAVLGSRAHPWGSAHLSHPWEHSGVAAEMAGTQEGVLGLGPGVSVPRTTTGGAGLPAAGGHRPARGECSSTLGWASGTPTVRTDLGALALGVSVKAQGTTPALGQPPAGLS